MNKVFYSFIIMSCLLMAACKKKLPPVNPEVPVNIIKAKAEQVLYFDNYPATTTALNQVNLLPQLQGAITGIYFKEGGHVNKGQKLYEIDERIYEANYDAALANLKVQQGNLQQAQQDADRYEYLNKNNAVAKQTYDHAIIALQNAKNQVASADQAVKSAKTSLNYTAIYAPFSGTIGLSQVKLGNVVSAGTTVLNTISTDDPMAVDFIINEKQLPRFEKLFNQKNAPTDSLFTLQLPDNTMYPFTGKISVIDRAVDPQTGSITVRLVFPNPKFYLRPGMSCVVKVHNQDTKPQLVLPNKALIEQMGEFFVFVAKDTVVNDTVPATGKISDKKELLAVQKKVQTGQTIGPKVIIKNGLNPGERVIVDGVQSLHNGTVITTAIKIPPAGKGR